MFGIDIIINKNAPAPRPPTDAENAVRIVRHGLADVLAQLGEKVGAAIGESVHTAYLVQLPNQFRVMATCHPHSADAIRAQLVQGVL